MQRHLKQDTASVSELRAIKALKAIETPQGV
jgi:hypothetical protein